MDEAESRREKKMMKNLWKKGWKGFGLFWFGMMLSFGRENPAKAEEISNIEKQKIGGYIITG